MPPVENVLVASAGAMQARVEYDLQPLRNSDSLLGLDLPTKARTNTVFRRGLHVLDAAASFTESSIHDANSQMKICMSTWRRPTALLRLCVAGLSGAQRSPRYFEVNPMFQSLATQDSLNVGLQDENTLADNAFANPQREYALVQRLAGLVQADAEQKLRRFAGMRFRPATQTQHRLPAGRRLTATCQCRLDCSLPPNDRDASRSAAPAIIARPPSADGRIRSAQFVLQ